jgi:uncharacterized protein YjbI with pentapeptide repeats
MMTIFHMMSIKTEQKTSLKRFAGLAVCALMLTIVSNPTWNIFAVSCTARGPNVDLNGCDFSGANFRGVDLSGANLSGADFSGADLSGANLSGANLINTDFTNANLSGVISTGCIGIPIGTPAQGTLPVC